MKKKPKTAKQSDKSVLIREKMVERMKIEFVSLVAHQLRTPLSAAKWSLIMLLDGEFGPLNSRQEKSLKITYDSNERIINLINDLLDVASIEEGKYLKNFESADIVQVVNEAVALCAKEAAEKEITVEFDWPKQKRPKILIDKEKIKLAIQNLVENAIKYSFDGGSVRIALTKTPQELQVKVADRGIGIPEPQQKRVFSKFFRATNASRAETKGTGLGLFLAKNIIEAHGGKIWFESKENEGTIFYFALPVMPVARGEK